MDAAPDPRRWKALAVIGAAYVMVGVDTSIVNLALPSIHRDFGVSQTTLQWVASAYVLTFGSLLLLGGRAGDYLGRRRSFTAGLALFTHASLLCGLATSVWMLIAFRALQGVASATMSPAVFSIAAVTFREGAERNRALGILGGLAGAGVAVGVVGGGMIVDLAGWQWVFLINVPIGLVLLALVRRYIAALPGTGTASFDLLGALLVTGCLVCLVFGLTRSTAAGWGSMEVIGTLVGSVLLGAAFLIAESLMPSPLVPLAFLARRVAASANAISFLTGASAYSFFVVMGLYMQEVLGYSPFRTGVGYLANATALLVSANLGQRLLTRFGLKVVLVGGRLLLTAALVYIALIRPDGSYFGDVFAGLILIGAGVGATMVALSIAALAGVRGQETGLASGLLTMSQMIGGAVGIAVLITAASHRTLSELAAGSDRATALTSGYSLAFWISAGFSAVALVLTLVVLRRSDLARAEPAAAPAA